MERGREACKYKQPQMAYAHAHFSTNLLGSGVFPFGFRCIHSLLYSMPSTPLGPLQTSHRAHRVVRSSARDACYSSAPAQPSEHGPCLKFYPPASQPLPPRRPPPEGASLGVVGRLPTPVGREGPVGDAFEPRWHCAHHMGGTSGFAAARRDDATPARAGPPPSKAPHRSGLPTL